MSEGIVQSCNKYLIVIFIVQKYFRTVFEILFSNTFDLGLKVQILFESSKYKIL